MKNTKCQKRTKAQIKAAKILLPVLHYTPEYIQQIIAAAMVQVPGATSVMHIRPRAYCIAKPGSGCAVFVTPPQDAALILRDDQRATSDIVYSGAHDCKLGEWHVLAYVCTPTCSETHVIKMPYQL